MVQGRRRVLEGRVTSDRMDKTIMVEVQRLRRHPRYERVVRRRKRFMAHDEENTCRVGDTVRIEESRPLSRRKRWRLIEVLTRASDRRGTGRPAAAVDAAVESPSAAEPAAIEPVAVAATTAEEPETQA